MQIIISVIIGIVIGGLFFYCFNRWSLRKKYVERAEYAKLAEEEAEKLLERNGFQILERKPRANVITIIDGKEHFGYVQADFIVSKDKKIYIAEVKAGPTMVDPNEPAIRRQLLEYDYVYSPDGLLLVDMAEKQIHAVGFKFPKEEKADKLIFYLSLGAVTIIFLAIIWMFFKLRLL